MNDTPQTMPRKAADSCTIYLRPVPAGIKGEFKAQCARRGITMLEALTQFMRASKHMLPLLPRIKAQMEREAAGAITPRQERPRRK